MMNLKESMVDEHKKYVIARMSRDLALTDTDVRHLSLDLFGKSYDSLTNEDANEMIRHLRMRDGEDYLEMYE